MLCRVPKGLEDVSTYPALFTALLASDSWSIDDLKKLAGLNFLRVLKTVEEVRKLYNHSDKTLDKIFLMFLRNKIKYLLFIFLIALKITLFLKNPLKN